MFNHKHHYVVTTACDTFEPTDDNRPIVWEQYLDREYGTIEHAIKRRGQLELCQQLGMVMDTMHKLLFAVLSGLLLLAASSSAKPIKVFILAGDENVLENGLVVPGKKAKSRVGTLVDVVANDPKYASLKDKGGNWSFRDDVMLYDAHSIHNNTEAPAQPVKVGVIGRSGPEKAPCIGVDLMLSHCLGEALDEPVLIIRYGVKHQTWFKRGSRDLSHDFRPPSSGGGSDLDGSWDVIHFNHGVWDAIYRDPSSKYFSGHKTTSVEDFEKNLRTLVGKMKQTGAILIWGWATRPNAPTQDTKGKGWNWPVCSGFKAMTTAHGHRRPMPM